MNVLKNALIFASIALFVAFSTQAYAHRTVSDGVIHHVAQSACQVAEKAEAEARDLAIKSAKDYCRKEGFGWRAASIKDIGNLDCHRSMAAGSSAVSRALRWSAAKRNLSLACWSGFQCSLNMPPTEASYA